MTITWWSASSTLQVMPSTPELLVAGDGKWETAVALPLSASADRLADRIRQVAATAERDVAVEVFWPGQSFVGVRWGLGDMSDALAGADRARVTVGDGRLDSAGGALLALLGSRPSAEPDFAELGAVKAWQSVGPLTLWRRGQAFRREHVDEALDSRPDLLECTYPVAVELATSKPRDCWVGVTVSESAGRRHHLKRDILLEVLAHGAASR